MNSKSEETYTLDAGDGRHEHFYCVSNQNSAILVFRSSQGLEEHFVDLETFGVEAIEGLYLQQSGRIFSSDGVQHPFGEFPDDNPRADECAEIDKWLLSGACIDTKDATTGDTPLITSIRYRHTEVAQHLLRKGANATIANSEGNPPIYFATTSNLYSIVCLLVEYGADINAEGARKMTALSATAGIPDGHKMVELLLKLGAEINNRSGKGDTALHSAVRGGRYRTVRLLLDRGADAAIRNNGGETPLDIVLNQRKRRKQSIFDRGYAAVMQYIFRADGYTTDIIVAALRQHLNVAG